MNTSIFSSEVSYERFFYAEFLKINFTRNIKCYNILINMQTKLLK